MPEVLSSISTLLPLLPWPLSRVYPILLPMKLPLVLVSGHVIVGALFHSSLSTLLTRPAIHRPASTVQACHEHETGSCSTGLWQSRPFPFPIAIGKSKNPFVLWRRLSRLVSPDMTGPASSPLLSREQVIFYLIDPVRVYANYQGTPLILELINIHLPRVNSHNEDNAASTRPNTDTL